MCDVMNYIGTGFGVIGVCATIISCTYAKSQWSKERIKQEIHAKYETNSIKQKMKIAEVNWEIIQEESKRDTFHYKSINIKSSNDLETDWEYECLKGSKCFQEWVEKEHRKPLTLPSDTKGRASSYRELISDYYTEKALKCVEDLITLNRKKDELTK